MPIVEFPAARSISRRMEAQWSEPMNSEETVQELEPGVVALGAAYFGILLALIAYLAP